MLLVDNFNDNNVLSLRIRGKLSVEDYESAVPEIEEAIEKAGPVRFFIRLEDFSGFAGGALGENIRFVKQHKDEFEKTAVVGDGKWEEWGTQLADLFFEAEMKFFEEGDSVQAWRWINN